MRGQRRVTTDGRAVNLFPFLGISLHRENSTNHLIHVIVIQSHDHHHPFSLSPAIMVLTASASVQSHLSALNSQPRHRDHPRPLPYNTEKLPQVTSFNSDLSGRRCSLSSTRGLFQDPLLPLSDRPLPRSRVWPNSFRWLLSGYIVVSLVFFSASLYRRYCDSFVPTLQSTTSWQARSSALSSINTLLPAARLAKLFPLHPPPIHFGPFTYRSVIDPHSHEVTACLWALESNLDWVPSWTNDWLGNPPAFGLSYSYIVNRSDLSCCSDSIASSVD